MDHDYEVIVIGGGAAGLAAAVALTRSRRSVLVVDGGRPRNSPAEGVHNYLTREGIAPAELVRLGRAEVRGYGGEVREGRALSASVRGDGFEVWLDDGSSVTARRLVLTTGVVDELPEVDGLAQRWGHDVLHCPYCHGWEVRDQVIGVIGVGPGSVHQALMFRQLSTAVTLLANDVELGSDALAQLAAAEIEVVPGKVEAVTVEGEALSGVRLADGSTVALDAVVVASHVTARGPLLDSLGIETVEHVSGMGDYVATDETGQSSVPGVYVAGNLADVAAQVMGAASSGTRAGAMVNLDLITSDLRERMPS